MRKNVLVVGSLNVDQVLYLDKLPLPGETLFGRSMEYSAGGKGANQAVALSKMECQVSILGAIGKDQWGKFCKDKIKSSGVDVNEVKVLTEQPTGLALISVAEKGINTIIVLKGANNFVPKTIIDENINLLQKADAVVCQLEINEETTFYALKKAKELNKLTFLNPAPAIKLTKKHLEFCDYLIPNETELSICSGVEITNAESIVSAIKKINSLNKNTKVIVTYGAKGVFYYDYKKSLLVNIPAKKVKAIDTTAAGDSFIGGFISQILENKIDADAIEFGIRVASVTVSRKGAQDSIPSIKEI